MPHFSTDEDCGICRQEGRFGAAEWMCSHHVALHDEEWCKLVVEPSDVDRSANGTTAPPTPQAPTADPSSRNENPGAVSIQEHLTVLNC